MSAGEEALSSIELLAILLRIGDAQGGGVMELAAKLLARFGSLRGIARASTRELCHLAGVGPAKACQIKAAFELGRRCLAERQETHGPMLCSEDVFAIYSPRMADRQREEFCLLMLDAKNRLLKQTRLAEGTLDSCTIHPRDVFAAALREGAAAVIFIHNHPSGDSTPSLADTRLTYNLAEAGRMLGIEVLDHIIVGDGEYFSFADRGLLKRGLPSGELRRAMEEVDDDYAPP